VLISEWGWGGDFMQGVFQRLQSWSADLNHFEMGAIHEIRLDRNTGASNRCAYRFTTLQFMDKFQTSSVAYVGSTPFNDGVIVDWGTFPASAILLLLVLTFGEAEKIWLLNPDYRLLKNNCQNFASSLVRTLTGEDLRPRTISELMWRFVSFSRHPAHKLRSSSLSPSNNSTHSRMPKKITN
jgi:hypothetical protein